MEMGWSLKWLRTSLAKALIDCHVELNGYFNLYGKSISATVLRLKLRIYMMKDLITLTIAVLAVLNPIGNGAIYVGMVSGRPLAEQRKVALVCSTAVAIILLVTTWLGLMLLNFFGISIGAFQVAGGLIVCLIGLSMLKGRSHSHDLDQKQNCQSMTKEQVAVVPLAIPIFAGPGAMTALIAHMKGLNSFADKLKISGIMVCLAIVVYVVLFLAPRISKILGEYGMQVVTRVMGLILVAIAFQMLGAGLVALLPGLA